MNESVRQLVNNIELPTDHLKDQDEEIREIFVEEVEEILEFLGEAIPEWMANPSKKDLLTDIRRSYHTLKGSGRMAGAVQSGELAWSVEELLNRVLADTVPLNDDIQKLVYSVAKLYQTHLVQDFKDVAVHQVDFRPFIVVARQLRDKQDVEQDLAYTINYYRDLSLETTTAETAPVIDLATEENEIVVTMPEEIVTEEIVAEEIVTTPVEEVAETAEEIIVAQPEQPITTEIEQPAQVDLASSHAEEISVPVAVETQADQSKAEAFIQKAQDPNRRRAKDPTLDIYYEETAEHLDTIFDYLRLKKNPSVSQINDLVRAIHTIRGSSGMVGIQEIFHHSTTVENAFKKIDQSQAEDLIAENQLLNSYYHYVKSYLTVYSIDSKSDRLLQLHQGFETAIADYKQQKTEHVEVVQAQQEQGLVSHLLQLDMDDLLDAEFAFVQEAEQDLETYLTKLMSQVEVLLEHTGSRSAEALNKTGQLLQRVYSSLLACYEIHPEVAIDRELLTQIQKLHQYLIDAFDGLASGQNIVITVLVEEDFEQTIEKIQRFGLEELTPAQEAGVDEATYESFLRDAEDLAVMINYDFEDWQKSKDNQKVHQLFRYLHTLKGHANSINATQLSELAHELENTYAYIWRGKLKITDEQKQTIVLAQQTISQEVERLKERFSDDVNSSLIADLKAISDDLYQQVRKDEAPEITVVEPEVVKAAPVAPIINEVVEPAPVAAVQYDANTEFDADLLDIFLEEADELVLGMDKDFDTWEQDPSNTDVLNNLFRYLHTLKGGANMVQATHLGMIAHELETIYERVLKGVLSPSAESMQIVRYAQDDIATRLQRLRDDSIDEANPVLLANLQSIATGQAVDSVATPSSTAKKADDKATASSNTANIVEETQPVEKDEFMQLVEAGIPPVLARAVIDEDDMQKAIAESFIEESQELLQQGQKYGEQWHADRINRNILLVLQRTYHTLKGNSRIVGLDKVADMAYQLEQFYSQVLINQFQSERYDHLIRQAHGWIENAIMRGKEEGAERLFSQLESISYEESIVDSQDLLRDDQNSDVIRYSTQIIGDGSTPPPMYGNKDKKQEQQSSEPIRISPDLIEKMIDLSGENAINRSRVEMDLGQMNLALGEMEQAILRLADQLRRMEGELEAQILTKHAGEGQRYEDFDPLEMDQYSSLNQLSKSLAESASDLIDFKNTLSEKIRDTEDLLVQQSRVQNELQQSLMGTRLVPFDRMIPRLQRLVRQTSTQLNRPVELHIENTEGELDRSILERLNSPFEHMLRNAIDHGIEDQETRLKAKKSRTGHIYLNITREGNDIVVSMQDDGRGIDVSKVRAKAEKNGLIAPDAEISDHEIIQYIFHAGLSTAEAVTSISGRGVGLDVVISEIKELGGDITVHSEQGKGTRFEIRVPTTVAVTDALMVRAGDQQFALPLAQIERIVRVSPKQLEQYYDSQDENFELEGQQYRLRYVGEFLNGQPKPALNHLSESIPVIIFNSAGRTVALQVDQLIGSRAQIVIKAIGKQMSSVGFIAGATILADGRVCLILDGQSIARRTLSTARSHDVKKVSTTTRTARQTIMVVDDSVTVRKVTSRLLERQGYDVITAKDGLDAVEKLGSVSPDLMLLDIEMPRMDGFEVANFVRTGHSNKALPIIMITSRTGEKHREHAFSLGVNRYMGKPFQEAELLATIQDLLEIVKENATL